MLNDTPARRSNKGIVETSASIARMRNNKDLNDPSVVHYTRNRTRLVLFLFAHSTAAVFYMTPIINRK